MPVYYECQRCTACCRWPGDVRVNDDEIVRMAQSRGVTQEEFVQQFTRLTRDRRGLSLVEKGNGECVFLEGDACSVQAVKPQQCRDFPNLWRFPGFERQCKSTPHNVELDQYVELVTRATGRPEEYVRARSHSD